jgi:hypothetical protein
MTELPETFTPGEIPEDERSFELIPQGNYDMQVIETSIEPCNGGEMLKLTMEIINGPYANRRLWDNLCIRHSNPETQRIAQRALADICLATGIAQLRDTTELHFKIFSGRVGIKKADQKQIDKGYPDDRNTVRYKGVGKAPAGTIQPKAAPQQGRPPHGARPAAQGAAKPWNQPKQAAKATVDLDDEIPFDGGRR